MAQHNPDASPFPTTVLGVHSENVLVGNYLPPNPPHSFYNPQKPLHAAYAIPVDKADNALAYFLDLPVPHSTVITAYAKNRHK